jgi:hypothetical protein
MLIWICLEKKLKTIGELMYFRFRLINFQSQDSSIEKIFDHFILEEKIGQ